MVEGFKEEMNKLIKEVLKITEWKRMNKTV